MKDTWILITKLVSFPINKFSERQNILVSQKLNQTRRFSKIIFRILAPEVILRQGYGKTIDYWSMGIILYEFLVGCVPFFGDTPEELFAHVVNDAAIEFPADDDYPLDPNSKDLITALLQQSPQDRLGSAGPQEVKEHPYLADLDWNSLLRYKVSFELFKIADSVQELLIFRPNLFHDWRMTRTRVISTPVLTDITTSLTTRTQMTRRFSHQSKFYKLFEMFLLLKSFFNCSFASYSPQYRKQYHSRQSYYGSDDSNSSINESGKLTPDFRSLNVSFY